MGWLFVLVAALLEVVWAGIGTIDITLVGLL
jgi:hypothetical protein